MMKEELEHVFEIVQGRGCTCRMCVTNDLLLIVEKGFGSAFDCLEALGTVWPKKLETVRKELSDLRGIEEIDHLPKGP